MKKFTVKDFLLYNGPCFSCGKKTAIKVVYTDSGKEFANVPITTSMPVSLDKGVINIRLKVKYSFSLDLQISVSNNRFKVSDIEKFITYLGMRDLYLISKCSNCSTVIISNPLQFDSKGYVKAISLMREIISIKDGNKICDLLTEYSTNDTKLRVFENTKTPLIMDLPLLPLYKFKTKEKLLNKIKTYILFS